MIEIKRYDYLLIGGGIMSATLGVYLKLLKPELSILMVERLEQVAQESSNPWNNAGTGHAALCELNYMPDSSDGSLPATDKAVAINEQFTVSRQLWSSLVSRGILKDPDTFIHSVPHMSFVRGAKDVDYLKRRFKALQVQPLFQGMEFSDDYETIKEWTPLLIEGRKQEPIAATRIETGTDVDYGAMTEQMIEWLVANDIDFHTSTEVTRLRKLKDSGWEVKTNNAGLKYLSASKVFVGAGGYALKLLQSSGIQEAKGFGTFPVSGHFLKTTKPELVSAHKAKVYSQAAAGAPPMSVPHLDTRDVDGKESLLFGPFAGINPKFLKQGSIFDLPGSVRIKNIVPYLSVALTNLGLMKYLLTEIVKSKKQKFAGLLEFVPNAKIEDWELYEAGQRAQVIAPNGLIGSLQFGTQVIASQDGSIAGLLGASPGASVSASVMLDVLSKVDPQLLEQNKDRLVELIPSYGRRISSDSKFAAKILADTAKGLNLTA